MRIVVASEQIQKWELKARFTARTTRSTKTCKAKDFHVNKLFKYLSDHKMRREKGSCACHNQNDPTQKMKARASPRIPRSSGSGCGTSCKRFHNTSVDISWTVYEGCSRECSHRENLERRSYRSNEFRDCAKQRRARKFESPMRRARTRRPSRMIEWKSRFLRTDRGKFVSNSNQRREGPLWRRRIRWKSLNASSAEGRAGG